jgi:MFS family permease
VATILALRVPETRERAPGNAAPAQLIHRQVIRPGLALFVGVAAGAGFLALAGLRAAELAFQAWSVVPLAYGLVVVGCRVIFSHVANRLPPLLVAAGSLGTSAAGLLVLSVTGTVPGILSGATVLGVGTAFLTPAVFAAIFNVVPAYERGAAAGTATVFIDLALGGGPLLLGFLAARSSIPVAFTIAALLTATGIPVLLRGPGKPAVDRS